MIPQISFASFSRIVSGCQDAQRSIEGGRGSIANLDLLQLILSDSIMKLKQKKLIRTTFKVIAAGELIKKQDFLCWADQLH